MVILLNGTMYLTLWPITKLKDRVDAACGTRTPDFEETSELDESEICHMIFSTQNPQVYPNKWIEYDVQAIFFRLFEHHA